MSTNRSPAGSPRGTRRHQQLDARVLRHWLPLQRTENKNRNETRTKRKRRRRSRRRDSRKKNPKNILDNTVKKIEKVGVSLEHAEKVIKSQWEVGSSRLEE